jgi:hypothetical protein
MDFLVEPPNSSGFSPSPLWASLSLLFLLDAEFMLNLASLGTDVFLPWFSKDTFGFLIGTFAWSGRFFNIWELTFFLGKVFIVEQDAESSLCHLLLSASSQFSVESLAFSARPGALFSLLISRTDL